MCIHDLLVAPAVQFDARGNPQEVIRYSYFVGAHGPFTDSFPVGTDTPDAVKAKQQERINQLRAVGADLPAGY